MEWGREKGKWGVQWRIQGGGGLGGLQHEAWAAHNLKKKKKGKKK